MNIGYKLLTAEMRSISDKYGAVTYGPDWQEIQGHGAYAALTLEGLLRGGYGPVLAEVEYEDPTGIVNDGRVVTARRVRVLRTAMPDAWAWARVAIYAARLVAHLNPDPRIEAAIQAAERCERERTPEAATAALEAAAAAWAWSWAAAWAAAGAAGAAEAAAGAAGGAAGAAEAATGAPHIREQIMARLVAEAWPVEVMS